MLHGIQTYGMVLIRGPPQTFFLFACIIFKGNDMDTGEHRDLGKYI